MIVDFHVHTTASYDAGIDPARLPEVAAGAGLDAVAVCDHDAVDGAIAAREAAARTHPELLVIVGEEVRTTDGEIIGWFLLERVPRGLTPEETVAAIKAQGGLVCVPHPCDRFRRSPLAREALERIASDVDAVEGLNARNLMAADDRAACAWAERRAVPVVAGSDAHTYDEVGRVRTELPRFEDAAGLEAALGSAELVGNRSLPTVHLYTAVKKRLPRRRT